MAKPLIISIELDERGIAKISSISNKVASAVESGAKKGQAGWNSYQKQLTAGWDKVKSKMLGVKSIMMQMAGVAGVGFLSKSMIDMSAKFEKSFANVTTLLGRSTVMEAFGKDVDAVRNQILGMAGDLGSAQEITEALYQAISAGVKPAESLEFVAAAAKAAKAGMTDVFTAVDAGTSVINAFGLTTKDATRVFDEMFKTVELGKITFEQLAGEIGGVAPMAAIAKVKTSELMASISALTLGGQNAADATTAVNAMLMQFLKPSDEAKKIAKELGISFGFAALQSKGLSGILKEIAEKTGGSADALGKLFGNVRSLRAVIPLASTQAEAFAEHLEKIGDSAGAVEIAFQKQIETFSGAMEYLKNKTQATIIQAVLPILQQLAVWFRDNEHVIMSWVNKALMFAISSMKLFIKTLPLIVEGLKILGGVLIYEKVAKYWGGFTEGVKKANVAIGKDAVTAVGKFKIAFMGAIQVLGPLLTGYLIAKLIELIAKIKEASGVAEGVERMYAKKEDLAAKADSMIKSIQDYAKRGGAGGNIARAMEDVLGSDINNVRKFRFELTEAIGLYEQQIDQLKVAAADKANVMNLQGTPLEMAKKYAEEEIAEDVRVLRAKVGNLQTWFQMTKDYHGALAVEARKHTAVVATEAQAEVAIRQTVTDEMIKQQKEYESINKEFAEVAFESLKEQWDKQLEIFYKRFEIEADLTEQNKNLEISALERVLKEQELTAEEQIKIIEDIKKKKLEALETQFNAEVAKYEAEGTLNNDILNMIKDKYSWMSDEIIAEYERTTAGVAEELTQQQKDLIATIEKTVSDITSVTQNVKGLLGSLGVDMSEETASLFDDYCTMVEGAGQFAVSIITGDIMGAINGAIVSLTGMFNLIGGLFAGESWEDKADKFIKGFGWDFSELPEDIRKAMEESGKTGVDLLQGFAGDIIEQFGVQTEDQLDMMSNALYGQYQDYIASGLSPEEAAKKIQPALNKLVDTAEENGWQWTNSMSIMGDTLSSLNMSVNTMTTYLERTKQSADGLTKMFSGFKSSIGKGFNIDEATFTTLAGSVAATFTDLIRQGLSFTEAKDIIDPILADIRETAETLNFDLSKTGIPELERYFNILEENSGLIDILNGAAESLSAVSSMGSLTQESFNAYLSAGVSAYNELINKGLTNNQALEQSSAWINAIYQAQTKYGYAVDASTQAMIDQAKQQGLIEMTQAEANEQMIGALNNIADILDRAFNPEKFKTWADSAVDNVRRVSEAVDGIGDYTIETNVNGRRGTDEEGGVPTFHDTPAYGSVFKKEGMGLFEKGDWVIPREGQASLINSLSGRGGGETINVYPQIILNVNDRKLQDFIFATVNEGIKTGKVQAQKRK